MLTSQMRERLLKQPPAERRKFFKEEVIVGHRKMVEVKKEVIKWVHEPADVDVINLVGPSGVGKSTLMHAVIRSIYEEAMPLLKRDPGFIPTGFITARNPPRGTYDWREHCIDTMISFSDVLVEQKVNMNLPGANRDDISAVLKKRFGNILAILRGAQNCLLLRHPWVVFVDEAQRMTKGLSPDGLIDQADTVRDFAFASKTLHVLLGTYALLGLRNLNGQLGRRSHTIHFERYKIELEDDAKEFASAFKTFQANLPLKKVPDLKQHIEKSFLRCLGCVGILKSWFARSLSRAMEDNHDTISSTLFLQAAPAASVSVQLAEEIQAGEDLLEEKNDDEAEEEIRRRLFGDEAEGGRVVDAIPCRGNESPAPDSQAPKTKEKMKNVRPFETKPERYPTGLKANGG